MRNIQPKTAAFVSMMTELSERPWLVTDFRKNPDRLLRGIPDLTDQEIHGIKDGNKGIIYMILCDLPIWKKITERIPGGYRSPAALVHMENEHDVDQMNDIDVTGPLELNQVDVDQMQNDMDNPPPTDFTDESPRRDGRAKEIQRKIKKAAEWFQCQST